jgi:hypothetical protein
MIRMSMCFCILYHIVMKQYRTSPRNFYQLSGLIGIILAVFYKETLLEESNTDNIMWTDSSFTSEQQETVGIDVLEFLRAGSLPRRAP